MELRPGYKKTEIGLIPEDWDAIPVGELFDFKNGLNKAKRFFGHGTPIVNYMDVFGQPGLRAAQIAGRVEVTKAEREAYEVRKGDVFFTRTSETVDEIGVAAAMLDPMKDAVYSGFVLRARPKDASLDDPFKAHCFSPRYFRQQVIARATYTTRALTNGRSLSAAILARPPVPEQKAIAKALSDVDVLIGSLSRLLAKKHDLRQGVMQRLLTGQTRLPGFDSPWKIKKVEELGEVVTGATPRTDTEEYWGGQHPWVTPTDIGSSRDIFESERQITSSGLASVRELPRNTVLVTCIASIGKNALLRKRGACNQQINAVVPNSENDAEFLYYMFESNKAFLLANSGITATRIISKKEFMGLEFLVPTVCEQAAIALVLSDLDAEIAALDARINKTRAIKQAMMQALLTGRVRLPVARGTAPKPKETAIA